MASLLHPPTTIFFSPPPPPPPPAPPSSSWIRSRIHNQKWKFSCCSLESSKMVESEKSAPTLDYKSGILDDFFLNSFRNKLVQEVGSDSEKPGYDGLIELVKRLLIQGRTKSETSDAAVRILKSLFPPLILELYKLLVSPIAKGKVAALMVARVTVLTCQWLMGPCKVNSVDLPSGESWSSGVYVEKCRYLEESKCVGVCINTCKIPTQTFFKDYMGVPLLMEPNFSDYSCQFKFGIDPPEDDNSIKEPCLEICPIASRRRTGPEKYPIA